MASIELLDFLQSGRYKIGLDRCNKSLKKSPSDARLLYFKASFLIGLGQPDEANKILDQLAQKSPPITDLNLLKNLDELATSVSSDVYPRPLSNGPRAAKLWTNATGFAGKKAAMSISHQRFLSAVIEQRWSDAGTALVALKKGDPNNRGWKLAHIAVQQMLAEAEADSRVADMNRMLAFRIMKQTSIDTAGDLRFLTQLYLRQGQAGEVLDCFTSLKDKDTAVSKQAFADWQFARQRIEICITEGRWDELRDLCSSLLGTDQPDSTNGDSKKEDLIVKDDWKVWSGLVHACDKLGELSKCLEYKPESAAAWKEKRQRMIVTLWVTLLLAQKSTKDGDVNGTSYMQTVQVAKEYFTAWQGHPFCYDDIKDTVARLPLTAQVEVQKHMADSPLKLSKIDPAGETDIDFKKRAECLTAEINALKFDYLLEVGVKADGKPEKIRDFACKAIRLVEVCHRNKLSTADATYLAAAALIRLYEAEQDVTYLFQAAYLLESGPAPEDAHPGRVMLVYLESEIGLHSLAMQQYKTLRVREIQYETMAHMFLSRVSISHPFAFEQKRQESIDPTRIIDEGLDVFLSSDQKLANAQMKLFEQGKCDLIFELQDLRNTLAHSLTRRMMILEQARISRLTDDVQEPRVYEVRPRVLDHWTKDLKDSRDYAETFNYDSVTKDSYPERRLQAGGKIPNSVWLKTAILAEDVWSLLSNRDTVCTAPSTPITDSEATSGAAELTTMESALIAPWNALLLATQALFPSVETAPKDAAANLQSRVESLQTTLTTLPLSSLTAYKPHPGLPPTTAHLQSHFLLVDLLRSCALFISTGTKKRSPTNNTSTHHQLPLPPKSLPALKSTIKSAHSALLASAAAAKKCIDAQDIVQALRNNGSVGDVLCESESLDKGLRAFAERAEASAREGWEGVARVRLGLN
ncbi:hypothetical protein AAFC00_002673 [Neodothiora populina]|uniref:Uncharacterized protein n=1 Tax=Neodothiora populina TaxID=2781224 RepID=A0ABR3P854_9PEZI